MRIFSFSLLILFSLQAFSQSEELYTLFRHHEYEKCLKKCDGVLEKDVDYLDAYWIKALIYFEMAQKPDKWLEITDSPLEESLRNLARIKSRDDDGSYMKERKDTLVMIKEMAEAVATEYKEKERKSSAIKMYKLIYRAFQGQEDALQLAEIYIKADDMMECIMQIDRIYVNAPPDVVPSTVSDPKALLGGISFLVKNFMFKDAFKMIEKYSEKFQSNPAMLNSFKKAVYLAVDTLYTNKDKALFFEYAQRGMNFYASDPAYVKHIEDLCVKMIKKSESEFLATEPSKRTWRDTAQLRLAFQYADMSQLLLPNNQTIIGLEKNLISTYHTEVPDNKKELFKKYALEVINTIRDEGCYCDSSGQRPSMDILKWNDILAELAHAHAKDMFAYNYTKTVNRRGLDTKGRIDETELKGTKAQTIGGMNFVGALSVGENIGYGVSIGSAIHDEDYKVAIEKMVKKWVDTKTGGSCERIMDFQFTDMGMAVFGDKWVLMFAYVLRISDK